MNEYFKLGNYCSIFHIYHSGVGSQQCFTSLQLRQFNLIPTVQLYSNTYRAEGVRASTLLPICMGHQLEKSPKISYLSQVNTMVYKFNSKMKIVYK